MANQPHNSHSAQNPATSQEAQAEEKRIAKEMSPFLIYAALPVLLIVFIALKFGPSY